MLETIFISTIILFATIGVVNEFMRLRINFKKNRELKKSLSVFEEEIMLFRDTRELFQKNAQLLNDTMEKAANIIEVEADDIKSFMEKEYSLFLSFVRGKKDTITSSMNVKSYTPTETTNTPIETLNMHPRTTGALIRNGIGSIEKLCTYNENKIANLRGIGENIIAALRAKGLRLQQVTPITHE